MPRRRFDAILARRNRGTMVILDIAVPRDFDPRIHDGDRACLFNIDDLQRIRTETIAERQRHVAPAEAIVEAEVKRFERDWKRRRNGPLVAKLIQECDAKRKAIVGEVRGKLNGKLTPQETEFLEGAFRLFQSQILHGPISTLAEESAEPSQPTSQHSLRDALHKLFRLGE